MAAISQPQRKTPFLNTKRGRDLLENLTAYVFLLPAIIIIFLFGIFSVAFAMFVSLHRWRRFPGEYQGLDNYTRALDNFAYVFFFWLALAALVYAALMLWRLWRESGTERGRLLFLLPGLVNAGALLL